MEQQRYLIDTNAIIEYLGATLPEDVLNRLDSVVGTQFFLSVINKIELLGFAHLTRTEEKKITHFIESAFLISLENSIVEKTIAIRKSTKIKLPDAIIAATAMEYDLTIITRNVRDFEQLKINLIDSYKF